MRVLLDTHLLLWAAQGPEALPAKALEIMGSPENTLIFSVASIWEITIKSSLGRNDFRVDPRLFRRGLLDNGYLEMPILSEHVVATKDLPPIHKDPFDRLLVAQANSEGITLLTADPEVADYPGPVLRV